MAYLGTFLTYHHFARQRPTKRYRTRKVAAAERGLPIALEFCLRSDLASYLPNREKAALERSCKGLQNRVFKKHERFIIQDMLQHAARLDENEQYYGFLAYWNFERVQEMFDVYDSEPHHVNLEVRVPGQYSALEYCIVNKHFNFLREFKNAGTRLLKRSGYFALHRDVHISLLYLMIKMTFHFKKSDLPRERIQLIHSTRLDILLYFLRRFHQDLGYTANICLRMGANGRQLAPNLLTSFVTYACCFLENNRLLPENKKLSLARFRQILMECKKMGMRINEHFSRHCPILLALQSEEPEILEVMLDVGVDVFQMVNIFPILGIDYATHALFVCIHHGMKPIYLDRILKFKPEWVDQRGHFEYTALSVAVISKRWDLVKVLLKHGANPNVQCKFRMGSHQQKSISLLVYALHHQYYYFLAEVFMIKIYQNKVREVVETCTIYKNCPKYQRLTSFLRQPTPTTRNPMPMTPAIPNHKRHPSIAFPNKFEFVEFYPNNF